MFHDINDLLDITNGAYSSNLSDGMKDRSKIRRDIEGYFNRYNALIRNKDKDYIFPALPNPIGWMNSQQYRWALEILVENYDYERDHVVSSTIMDERNIEKEDVVVPAYTIAMEQLMRLDNHSVEFPDPEQEYHDKYSRY